MKKSLFIAAFTLIVAACGGGAKKETASEPSKMGFAPVERQSAMSDAQRQQAIAQKRAELNNTLDMEEIFSLRGVKLSIVVPHAQGDITEEVAENIAFKMLDIVTRNGISGLGTSPEFVMGATIMQTGRAVTSTVPQKMTVKYELNYKVMNVLTGDVYATATQEIMGVGASFAEANTNAITHIKNTPQMQQMLQKATDHIIAWYNMNLGTLKNRVDAAAASGDYALALAMVDGVPQAATEAFEYATEKQPELFAGLQHKVASEMLAEMTAAIAAADIKFEPKIAAYLAMIPTDAPEYAQAKADFAAYEKKCKDYIRELEEKAERQLEADRAYEMEMLKQERAHELAMTGKIHDYEMEMMKFTQVERLKKMEVDGMVAKYEAQANAAAMERTMRAEDRSRNRGFFRGLGDRILGGIDFIGNAISAEM